jgi:endogenous inhibitor of DNA gyrase (YacG/DUF329 family)
MKIVSQVYAVGCPKCGKNHLHSIPTKRDGSMKNKPVSCPKCHNNVVFVVIGKTERFNDDRFEQLRNQEKIQKMIQSALTESSLGTVNDSAEIESLEKEIKEDLTFNQQLNQPKQKPHYKPIKRVREGINPYMKIHYTHKMVPNPDSSDKINLYIPQRLSN